MKLPRCTLMFTAALFALAAAPGVAAAQTDARLAGAVTLAQEGRGDSARAVVQQVLSGVTPSDPLYVEALLARARVAASADTMRRQLQEITVEHALSPWADDALLALLRLRRGVVAVCRVDHFDPREIDARVRRRMHDLGGLPDEDRGDELHLLRLDGAFERDLVARAVASDRLYPAPDPCDSSSIAASIRRRSCSRLSR